VDLFATAAKGTETALRDELNELGFSEVRADRGGVHFSGSQREAYRACLWSRIAMRVLAPVARFDCRDESELYDGVFAVDFSDAISIHTTLAVSAACRSSQLTHTQYIAQKTKDAIVDRLRERHGSRPDVDRKDPDVHVFVHLVRDRATVYLDYAGAPLHQRGYRTEQGEAPLKETLAAALLRLTGFDGEAPFMDPMCGSGTLVIEAALWGARCAPGLFREQFGFERWASFGRDERAALEGMKAEARALVREGPPAFGSDIDAEALARAAENARAAGVRVVLRSSPLRSARPESDRGVLVTNPPYGERIASSPEQARELARLVDRFPDWNVGILLAEEQNMGRTRRKPKGYSLFNGNIACTLRTYSPITRRAEDVY
jgi:putative N6-adenine-specific DNA methylase